MIYLSIDYIEFARRSFLDQEFLGPVANSFIRYFGTRLFPDVDCFSLSDLCWKPDPKQNKSQQMGSICYSFSASYFICGKSSIEYFNKEDFPEVILIEDIATPAPYEQKWNKGDFEPELSIIDLIANVESYEEARVYL